MMSDNPYCVYVIAKKSKEGLCSPVKVGISNDPNRRTESIQTACPFKIELVYVFECPNREIAEHLERSFHTTQIQYREYGEWFSHPPLVAIHLLCIGYRAMLQATCPDVSLHEPLLDQAGVFWAEKRFGLNAPRGALQ